MTQEEKKLLLKDLCARLPYNVKVDFSNTECILSNIGSDGSIYLLKNDKKAIYTTNIQYIKPYLHPMSSMTEEEKIDFQSFFNYDGIEYPEEYIDWLNAHHIDYRGLIEKGLALEAPNGMYN